MSDAIRLRLPVPPSVNAYWKPWRGRLVKTAEAKRYQQAVKLRGLQAHARPLLGEVSVSLSVFRPARRGDLDGYLKLVLDSLQGVAFENDSQVVEIHAGRFEDPAQPRVDVCIEPRVPRGAQ